MKALDTVQRSVNITKTQICVDSVQDGEPSGFLYNPYMPERIAFFGYLSLINVMDRFFDRMQCRRHITNTAPGRPKNLINGNQKRR